jgi:hypothetical protein
MTAYVDTRNFVNKGMQVLPQVDKCVQARVALDERHQRIHNGEHFLFSAAWTGIASADWVGLAWRVADDQGYTFYPHFRFNVTSGQTCLVQLYETATADGVFFGSGVNSRRPSANTPQMGAVAVTSADNIGWGTLIFSGVVTAGAPLHLGGNYGLGEIIGKQNGDVPANGSPGGPGCYFLKITAQEADAVIGASLGWYEWTDKE